MKKFLSILSAFFILLSAVPLSGLSDLVKNADFSFVSTKAGAASEDDLHFNINKNDDSYYVSGCSSEVSGSLDVPSVYNGKPVTGIGEYAFYGCIRLTSITIPESITSIGEAAFSECNSLTSIDVSAENTTFSSENGILFDYDKTTLICCPSGQSNPDIIPESVRTIGSYAFYGCDKFTEITIPENVTVIGDCAFSFCSGLLSVTIPESVTEIGNGVFFYCNSLSSINVSADNETYSSVDGVLFNKDKTELVCFPCGKSESYDIPNGVTKINAYAFCYCTKLVSLSIPESVVAIGDYAFNECESLVNVFYGGTGEEWLLIDTSSGNDYLTENYIHYNVSAEEADNHIKLTVLTEATCTEDGEISVSCDCGYSYFQAIYAYGHNFVNNTCTRCGKKISSISLNGTAKAVINDGGDTDLFVFAPEESGYCWFFSDSQDDTYGYLYNSNMEQLSDDDDGGHDSNFCISYYFKAGEIYYLSAEYYSSVATGEISVCLTNKFYGGHYGKALKSVNPTCTEQGYTQYECRICGEIFNYDYVNAAGHSYTESASEATCITGKGILHKCSECGVSYIDNVTSEPVGHNYVDGVCKNCGWLEDLEYSVKDGFVTVTGFNGNATELTIPSHLCGLPVTSIGNEAFSGCGSLRSIVIPETVISIGRFAFNYCEGLTSITIPAGVSVIGEYAFYNCSNLLSADIPDSVTNIGENAFTLCEVLIINCSPNGYVREYAETNGIRYMFDIANTNNSTVDYTNKLILTGLSCISDISDIVTVSSSIVAVPQASFIKGNTKIYGTGSTVSLYKNDVNTGDYKVIVEGDLDGDGVCDVLDVSTAEKALNKKTTVTSEQIYAANGCYSEIIDITSYQNVVNTALS